MSITELKNPSEVKALALPKEVEVMAEFLLTKYEISLIKSDKYFSTYSILVAVSSEKEAKSLGVSLIKSLKDAGLFTSKIVQESKPGWCITDVPQADCLVHIITQEKLSYYKLEEILKK